jgi:YtkA-like protein
MKEEMTMNLRTTNTFWKIGGALIVVLSLAASAARARSTPKTAKNATASKVDVMLMSPTAPKSGDNTFEVMVKGADGKPITDADVSVVLVDIAQKKVTLTAK